MPNHMCLYATVLQRVPGVSTTSMGSNFNPLTPDAQMMGRPKKETGGEELNTASVTFFKPMFGIKYLLRVDFDQF